MTEDELQKAILNGISFKKAPKKSQDNTKAVKTKAKKKAYYGFARFWCGKDEGQNP